MEVDPVSALPVMVIVVPLACAFAGALITRYAPRLLNFFFIAAALVQAGLSLRLFARVQRLGPLLYEIGGWPAPWGILLVADELAAVFVLLVGTGLPAALLFSAASGSAVRSGTGLLLLLLTAASAGVALTGDLFNLFVFMELTSVCSVGLIARKRTGRAAGAAFAYLLLASLSGLLLLLAVILLYGAAGTLNMAHLAALAPSLPPRVTAVALACTLVSFGIKVGMVPLHFWQPAVYGAAGCTVAGALSGVVMSCGMYGLARVLHTALAAGGAGIPALPPVLLAAGCVNVLAGHTLALCEKDLKKLLAYSSVAHAGYILMGFGLGSAAGFTAALLHTFNHMLMKTAAFWSARAFVESAGSPALRRMRGMARAAPLSLGCFAVAVLALVGIPPLHGFTGKWLLARASLGQDRLVPVLVIAVGTVLSLVYYARFFQLALYPTARPRAPMERLAGAQAVLLLLALACLLGGFAAGPWLPFLDRAAFSLADPASYVRLVFPEGLPSWSP